MTFDKVSYMRAYIHFERFTILFSRLKAMTARVQIFLFQTDQLRITNTVRANITTFYIYFSH